MGRRVMGIDLKGEGVFLERLNEFSLLGEDGGEVVVGVGAFTIQLNGSSELPNGFFPPTAIRQLNASRVV